MIKQIEGIKNENRCKQLIHKTLEEVNRQEYDKLSSEYKLAKSEEQTDLSERINQAVKRETEFDDDPATELRELEKEYNRLADELRQGFSGVITKIRDFNYNPRAKDERRLEQIDKWLQTRLQRFGVEADANQKIKHVEREIKRIENEGEKRDYRIGKLESEVKSVESKINQNRNTFDKIAKQSKIEWFRNSWMNYTPQNVVEEIKYWLS